MFMDGQNHVISFNKISIVMHSQFIERHTIHINARLQMLRHIRLSFHHYKQILILQIYCKTRGWGGVVVKLYQMSVSYI